MPSRLHLAKQGPTKPGKKARLALRSRVDTFLDRQRTKIGLGERLCVAGLLDWVGVEGRDLFGIHAFATVMGRRSKSRFWQAVLSKLSSCLLPLSFSTRKSGGKTGCGSVGMAGIPVPP